MATQPRLPDDRKTPTPPPFPVAASRGEPANVAEPSDSMDVLLEAIGSQPKPFVPKRTSATAGERSAVYQGRPQPARPATNSPIPGASVIVAEQDSDFLSSTELARNDIDIAIEEETFPAAGKKKASTTTMIVDPKAPSKKLLRWTVAGVLIAACFVGAAAIHNTLEKARETSAGPPAPSTVAVLTPTATVEPSRRIMVLPPAPVEPRPPRPAPEPVAKKPGKYYGRGAKVGSGLDQEPAQGAPAGATAASPPPKKPKANVPGLEDLKTTY